MDEFVASYHEAADDIIREIMALIDVARITWTDAVELLSLKDIKLLAEMLQKKHGPKHGERAGSLPPGVTPAMLRGEGVDFGDGNGE